MEVLSVMMQGAPTPEAIARLANESPDKWATMIKTMATLSGYHDKIEVSKELNINVSLMGDAELMEHLGNLNKELIRMGIEAPSDDSPIDVDASQQQTKKEEPEGSP